MRVYLSTHDAEVSKTGWGGFSKTSGLMRQDDSLKWVNPLELKAAAEKAFEEKFGKKEDAKKAQAEKAKKVRPRSRSPSDVRLLHSMLIPAGGRCAGVQGAESLDLDRNRSRRRVSRRHVQAGLALTPAQARRE